MSEWKNVRIEGKIRKGKGRWYQLERKDGRKFILAEVEQFVEEKKTPEKKAAW